MPTTISAPGCAASSRYAAAMTTCPKSRASSAAARSEWDRLPTYTGDRKKPPGKTMASTGCQSTRLTTASTTWSSSEDARALRSTRLGLRPSTHTVTTRGGRMTVLLIAEAVSAVGDDGGAYTMFQSCSWSLRSTSFGSFLPCCPRDASFCRRGYRVGHCRADRLQESDLPVGIARYGQRQQSVADHGIRLAEHFGQLLTVRNADCPSDAEVVMQRHAGEVADEQAGTAEIHVVRQFAQCGDQFAVGNGQHTIHQPDGGARLLRWRRWSKEG